MNQRFTEEKDALFRHTLVEGDRLDHLAYRYYDDSLEWRRICDANSEFQSPLALLGRSSLRRVRFDVEPAGASGKIADLLNEIRSINGVESAVTENAVATLRIDYNERTPIVPEDESRGRLDEWELQRRIIAADFRAGPPRLERRAGKTVRIPPR